MFQSFADELSISFRAD